MNQKRVLYLQPFPGLEPTIELVLRGAKNISSLKN